MTKTHVKVTVRRTTVTNRGKTFTVFEPLKPLHYFYVLGAAEFGGKAHGKPASFRIASLLASLSADHPEAVVHIPTDTLRPIYFEGYPEKSLHLALCHHSLQLRYSDWKDIRNRLRGWQTVELKVANPAINVECEEEHWQKHNANVFDLKEAAHTQFLIGSQPILAYLANIFYGSSTATDDDEWHLHLFSRCRNRNFSSEFQDDFTSFAVPRKYWPK